MNQAISLSISGISTTRPRLRLATWATRVLFFVLGLGGGVWGVHIPTAKAHYGLSKGQLAFTLLATAIGSIACLSFAGSVVSRFGARPVTRASGIGIALILAALLVPSDPRLLVFMLLLLGAMWSLLDVSINAEGSVIETVGGQPVMSGLHAMFSLGGMSGAAAAAIMLKLGVAPTVQMLIVATVSAMLVVGSVPFLLPAHPQEEGARAHIAWPSGVLRTLGLLAIVALLAEGVMYNWSVLYMKQELNAAPATAALAFATFSAAMALARLSGDVIRARLRPAVVLRGGSLMAAIAVAIALAVRSPMIALVGFAIAGLGLANVIPVLYLAASKTPGIAAPTAIALVSGMGYVGFIAGPPLVGGIAEATSLTWAMGVVVAGSLALALGARRLTQ